MEPAPFIPGLYRHYKGALYQALMLVTHHETNLKYVVYIPYEHPESGVRLCEYDHGDSPWIGFVQEVKPTETEPGSTEVSRFTRILPEDLYSNPPTIDG